jgi:hypothetical protein
VHLGAAERASVELIIAGRPEHPFAARLIEAGAAEFAARWVARGVLEDSDLASSYRLPTHVHLLVDGIARGKSARTGRRRSRAPRSRYRPSASMRGRVSGSPWYFSRSFSIEVLDSMLVAPVMCLSDRR